ncbi:GAF domain-containing protein [Lysobacter sp. TY2-98]|uniref:sensor domain-containing diguanylate cyclase n=1 Tax=Lysobacter sp. TY2-98 TaxID=2290922 RepID=UPI000E200087|nr:GAF domain-containing protein [Lysobacter sp. TY2-98]AXK72759.1 GAF domain-containing protein [Lysobacter sp. TY2-98]
MPAAPLPANELSRQALLEALGILDTPPEDDYDDIVRIAAAVCRAPIATISLVDADRQWFKARVGLDDAQTPRSQSFCAHAILDPNDPLVVEDATADPRFADNPLVTERGMRFYAGAPIEASGMPVGTVCVLDREPRSLTQQQVEVLQALARQVARMIEFRRASRLLKLHLREREWFASQLVRHESLLQAHAPQVAPAGVVDALTRLPGPAAFAEALDAEIAAHGRQIELQVARIEIDDLASFGAIHGHDEVERILRELASLLRAGEIAEGRVARVGTGFALLMPMPLSQAVAQCVRLADHAGNPASGVPVTLSIGLTTVAAGEGGADALECAEHALAQAQGAGGARVEVR